MASGCAQVPKEAGFGDVEDLVAQRIDYRLHWNQGTGADREVDKAIADLLKVKLTPEAAVQIALLNNPNLQVVYEELGITQADVVEAGLLVGRIIPGNRRIMNSGSPKIF
jgi:cobalt-zinc-cadmium efflux system outer membrane protein